MVVGHIWIELQAQIGASDILPTTIRLWFKNAVRKTRSTVDEPRTAYEEARKRTTTGGMPRFGTLPLETQRLLKEEVRAQYPSLPSNNTTEKLIEGAFDSIFKSKDQWDTEKKGRKKATSSQPEPSKSQEPSKSDTRPGGNALSISGMIN
ncbi:hypothetical protein Q9L58_005721 [Maublancomyces gigas]|uniref:Homeobox domain-containing protein n=1 Tax=Discina gigas TaxID=1032678 RepID=A0ABR3GHC3_9PEZI